MATSHDQASSLGGGRQASGRPGRNGRGSCVLAALQLCITAHLKQWHDEEAVQPRQGLATLALHFQRVARPQLLQLIIVLGVDVGAGGDAACQLLGAGGVEVPCRQADRQTGQARRASRQVITSQQAGSMRVPPSGLAGRLAGGVTAWSDSITNWQLQTASSPSCVTKPRLEISSTGLCITVRPSICRPMTVSASLPCRPSACKQTDQNAGSTWLVRWQLWLRRRQPWVNACGRHQHHTLQQGVNSHRCRRAAEPAPPAQLPALLCAPHPWWLPAAGAWRLA